MTDKTNIFDGVVTTSSNENFKQYRMGYITSNGKRLTQDEVATMLGLSDGQIVSKFERNGCNIDNRTYSLFSLVTNNHPLYNLQRKQVVANDDIHSNLLIKPPVNPCDIKTARRAANGLIQRRASRLLGMSDKIFGKYESNTAKLTHRRSPTVQTWTLFMLITNQHPYYQLAHR